MPATAVARGTCDGDVVLAIESDAGSRDSCTAGTGERAGAKVDVGQAARGGLHDDLCVYSFTACTGGADGRSRAGDIGLPHSAQTGGYPHRKRRRACDRERGWVAGGISDRVADKHGELRPVVGTGRGGGCVGGGGRSAAGDAVLPPLVAQWGSACCSDTEGRRLACRYGLASWLRGNRWRHRGRIDREGGCAAGNTTHRIANYDCEQRAIV